MKLELIKKDIAIHNPDGNDIAVKEILFDAFNRIMTFEEADITADAGDFEVCFSNEEETNSFSGAFITSMFGTYLLHDMHSVSTVFLYSLTKLSDE